MSDHGFIDPLAPTQRRIDRLEALLAAVLPRLDLGVLSPEAAATVADLLSEDATRQERARRKMQREMAEDPLPAPTPPEPATDGGAHDGRIQ